MVDKCDGPECGVGGGQGVGGQLGFGCDARVDARARRDKINVFINRAMSFMFPALMIIMNIDGAHPVHSTVSSRAGSGRHRSSQCSYQTGG